MIKQLPSERVYVTIPNPHRGKDIGVGILTQILREGGISRDEWFSAA
jgi:predicted RNA binding protein YcfA (HicA-like mRNA interferase family)